jgi:hypothetical protein
MLQIPSKYEERYILRRNSSFPSPFPPAFQLDGSAYRIAIELWWTNQEFSFADIIEPWFSILISKLETQLQEQEASINLLRKSGPLGNSWTRHLLEITMCLPKRN